MKKDWEKEVKLMQMEIMLANEKEYHKWQKEIPTISFPSDWEIRIIPPFHGAMVRFIAIKGDKEVSVCLDCYDGLGYYGEPYWEICPTLDGDADRFAMNDVEGLLKGIGESLGGKSFKLPTMQSNEEIEIKLNNLGTTMYKEDGTFKDLTEILDDIGRML